MFCTKCGNQCPDGATFCTACGALLQAPASPTRPIPPVTPPPVIPEYIPESKPAPSPRSADQKRRKILVIILLAFAVALLAVAAVLFIFRNIQKSSLKNRVVADLPSQMQQQVKRIYSKALPDGYKLSADAQDFDWKESTDGFTLYGFMTVTDSDNNRYDVVVEGIAKPNFLCTNYALDASIIDYDLPTEDPVWGFPDDQFPTFTDPFDTSDVPSDPYEYDPPYDEPSYMVADGYIYYDDFADPNAYILPSDTQYLTEYDLDRFTTRREMNIIYNEIFARHGHDFGRPWIRAYFDTKNWYYPVQDLWITPEDLSDVEQYNLELIRNYTQSHTWPDVLPEDE